MEKNPEMPPFHISFLLLINTLKILVQYSQLILFAKSSQ